MKLQILLPEVSRKRGHLVSVISILRSSTFKSAASRTDCTEVGTKSGTGTNGARVEGAMTVDKIGAEREVSDCGAAEAVRAGTTENGRGGLVDAFGATEYAVDGAASTFGSWRLEAIDRGAT